MKIHFKYNLLLKTVFIAFALSLNAFSNEIIPKDAKKYVLKSILSNTKPEINKLHRIQPTQTEWETVFQTNTNLLLKNQLHEYAEYYASIQTFSIHKSDCENYYNETLALINLNFKDNQQKSLTELLNKICDHHENIFESHKIQEEQHEDVTLSVSPFEILTGILNSIEKLPKSLSNKIKKTINDTVDIIFKDTSDGYKNGQTSAANQGLINYISNDLNANTTLLNDSIRFYNVIYSNNPLTDNNHGQVFDHSSIDYWKVALSTTDNDPWRAIQVLAVKGHDVIANALNEKYFITPESKYLGNLLNLVSSNRNRMFYQPEGIGGIKIPNKIMKKFMNVKILCEKYNIKHYYRSANYHFISGMYLTEELLRKGNKRILGIKTPTAVSDIIGYLYKRIKLESYLTKDALTLHKNKCTFYKCEKPKDMGVQEFNLAYLNLKENIAFLELTAWQHKAGANFAWEVLHK